MTKRLLVFAALFLVSISFIGPGQQGRAAETTPQQLSGLQANVRVIRDSDGVPHIYAQNDHDATFMLGYIQAQDRFFQMDVSRRRASGTLAELLGESALGADIEFRTIGVRRGAEESWDVYSGPVRQLLQAYSDGVNAYLQDPAHSLPPEYQELELTQVPPWTPVDSVAIAKSIAYSLSFDLDIGRTLALEAFQEQGDQSGFDGTALFFQDLYRSTPFDPAVSIPDFLSSQSSAQSTRAQVPRVRDVLKPGTLDMARRYQKKLTESPLLRHLADNDRTEPGSNWWVVSGDRTTTGNPILANDPHMTLDTPANFHEAHLIVSNDPEYGPMNVNGVIFAGTPSVTQGCNERICWGSTVNPMDVTDVYEEQLAVSLFPLGITHTVFDGEQEELIKIEQKYMVNQLGNGTTDDLIEAEVGSLEGGVTHLVPRRNMGPIVDVNVGLSGATGLSIQYSGSRATREAEAFHRWIRADNLQDFKEGLQYFDMGSQNWAYADVDGNIAYFTSAELPLREDLQSGEVEGLPPYLIRDGSHVFKNEWLLDDDPPPNQSLAYQILPFEEMPQVVNPASGFILNGNNDPVGVTLDGDPLNEIRPGGGIYYLNPGYASIRMGQISRLMEAALAQGPVDLNAIKQIQQNNQLLDASMFLPYIYRAFQNAGRPDAPQALADLGKLANVTEAVNRLSNWDFSTPTGTPEGYDPGDDPENLPEPSQGEILNSVAATIYSVWRGEFVRSIIDGTLVRAGLEGFHPDSSRSLTAIQNLLENFDSNRGIGQSGLDFFETNLVSDPEDRRDLIILQALHSALDRLSGEEFAAAYGRSTNQDDYRWGKLHRIVFDHPLGGSFNVPDGESFQDVSPALRGVARAGGFEVIDASSHSARSNRLNDFMFGSGSARRFVGELDPAGIRAFQIIPGGQNGLPGSPLRTDQLGRWLTNQHHPMRISKEDVESDIATQALFQPTDYRLLFPFYQGDSKSFTGFAVSSLADSAFNLTWNAYDNSGALLSYPQNPNSMELVSGTQKAVLGSEIFGLSISDEQKGWVELTGTSQGTVPDLGPALSSFTQFGAFNLGRLDGGTAFTSSYQELVFPRVFEGDGTFRGLPAETFLSIANPHEQEAEVALSLSPWRNAAPSASGAAQQNGDTLSVTIIIPPQGLVYGTLSEIFGTQIVFSQAYVKAEVQKGLGIVGFELILIDGGKTVLGLNAVSTTGFQELFSAQMAQTNRIFTNLNLINTGDLTRYLTLTAIDNQGQQLSDPVDLSLLHGSMHQIDVADLFGFTESVEGSLRVEVDGPGVVGDVIFGDPASGSFGAALALQGRPFTQAVFSQVGNTSAFFTGLAFFNPNSGSAEVQVQVFSSAGDLTGSATFTLEAGSRTSKLLAQIVPESSGQSGGYIVVQSSRPLIGQQLFGTYNLNLLSAVPPTVVQ